MTLSVEALAATLFLWKGAGGIARTGESIVMRHITLSAFFEGG